MWSFLMQALSDLIYFALHVVRSGSFPKPLSQKEEADAWVAYREQGDLRARDRLIEHNLRLVAHIIRKYYSSSREQDDLISIGTIGLMKAVSTFDYTKGTRLATYAARCIENEVLMQLRAAKKRRNDVSLTDPIGMDGEGNDISFQDILGTPGDMVEDAAIRHMNMQQVRSALKKLPQRERAVLEMRYGLLGGRPLLQHEVASKMGISRSYISRIEKNAIALIRDEIMHPKP